MANVIKPPFAWAGRHTTLISIVMVMLTGAFFRFYGIGNLPPGLSSNGANIGLQALDSIQHGLPGLSNANGYAPLWVMLQALSVKVLGTTILALILWPAVFGLLSILTTWLLVRSWFGLRTAFFASLLMAVTPWAVTLSRSDQMAGIVPFFVTLSLWLATEAWRRGALGWHIALGLTLITDLFIGPVGWLLVVTIVISAVLQLIRTKQIKTLPKPRLIGLIIGLVGLIGFIYTAVIARHDLAHLTATLGLTTNPGIIIANITKTLLMFGLSGHGDENYLHNLAGEPLFNVFISLMLVAGLLVSISRLHRRLYRLLLAFVIILLLPAVLTAQDAPNAARAIAALPLLITLAAIGISYMLELWYTTFPINSAARSIGQSAIITLLILTVLQGYTQYFRAWGSSTAVYISYHEDQVQIAKRLPDDRFEGRRYLVTADGQAPVATYLSHHKLTLAAIKPSQIATIPLEPIARQFTILPDARDDTIKVLRLKFPGGVLRPHYSTFNQTEIYYTYEVTK